MNKKAALSLLGKIMILIALFLVIVIVFIGPKGLITAAADAAKSLFGEMPEKDPTIWERNFYQNNEDALEAYGKMVNAMKKAADSSQDLCIVSFEKFPQTLYNNNYKILIRNEGGKIETQLLQYKVDALKGQQTNTTARNVPVSTKTVIQGVKPCVVMTSPYVESFYRKFNLLDTSIPNATIFGLEASSLYFSPSRNIPADVDPMAMEVKLSSNPSQGNWKKLSARINNDEIYILKANGMLCFIPVETDGNIFCGPPQAGYYDHDCFDRDDARTIDKNIKEGKLDAYLCR